MGGGGYTRARRAPTKGLAQSPGVVRTVPRPFTKGINTDLPSWALDPQETPAATDMIFPKGIAAARGPYISASSSGVIVTAGSNWLTSVMAADLPSYGGAGTQPTTPIIAGAAQNGTVGMITGGLAAGLGAPTLIGGPQRLLFREVYKGEFLICPQDGKTPIIRFAGAPTGSTSANSAPAGSGITYYQGSSFILGIGTNFLTAARVGTYIGVGAFPSNNSRLVVATDDDTHLSVDGVFPITTGIPAPPAAPPVLASGQTWGSVPPTRLGVLGLCIPVQTLGQASISTGLGTTVAGLGTLWNTANTPPGHGRPIAGDLIGTKGTYDRLSGIASITNDFTLTIGATPGSDYANRPYIIYRNAMGREARYHAGRLYITGVDWDNTGVYFLPVNAPLGAFWNSDSGATITSDYATSQCLLKFDVPIAGAAGKNVALLSTPQGLLVLRTDGAYLAMGDPPTQTVVEVAHGAGCIDILSACVGNRGEGAFWAGPNGIYRYVGGRVIDLTEGRRNREWRQKMATFVPDYIFSGTAGYVCCAVQDSHLYVSVTDATTPGINCLWVYDLLNNAWCGDFSGLPSVGISSMSMYRSTNASQTAADDVYMTIGGTFGGIDRSQAVRAGGMVRDEGGLANTTLHGTFSADLPESVTGLPDDHSRVTEMKVTYELQGTSATLSLQTGVDGSGLGTDRALPVTTNGPQTTPPIKPQMDVTQPAAGALGKLGRRHQTRLLSTGTKPSLLRVHHIDLVVRPRRHRA